MWGLGYSVGDQPSARCTRPGYEKILPLLDKIKGLIVYNLLWRALICCDEVALAQVQEKGGDENAKSVWALMVRTRSDFMCPGPRSVCQ